MTQLVIKGVRLENFLSHKNTRIEFIRGVNVFIGPNGAGKTSILEAIYYALTGRGWRTDGRNKRDLVNKNASTALVELEFTMGEDHYMVRRRIGGPGALLQKNNKTIARDEAGLNKQLSEIIGLDLEKLRSIALIPQGGITRIFVEERPSERKKILDTILGLQEYDEAGQLLVKTSIASSSRYLPYITVSQIGRKTHIDRIQGTVDAEYKRLRREVEKITREIEEAEKEIDKIKADIESSKLREKAGLVEKLEKEYEEHSSALNKLKGELEGLRRELEQKTVEKKEKERKIREISEKIRVYEEKTRIIEYRDNIIRLREALNEYNTVYKDLDRVKRELEELEKQRKNILELREKYPRTTIEIQEEKQVLEKKREELEQTLRRLREEKASTRTRLTNILEQLRKHDETIGKARRRAVVVDEGLAGVGEEELGKRIRGLREKLQREKEVLEQEINKTRLEIKRLEEDITDLIEKKTLLEKTRSPTCPLCGSPLTEEHRRKIIDEIEEKIRGDKENITRLEAELNKLVEEHHKVLEKTRILEDPVFTRLEEALVEKKKLHREYEALEKKLEEIEKELRETEEEIKTIREELRRLEEEYRGAAQRESLEKFFDEEKYRRLLEEEKNLVNQAKSLEEEINSLSNKLREIMGREASPPEILEWAEKKLEEAERLREELISLKTSLENLSARIRELEEEEDRLRRELGYKKKKYLELEKKVEEISAMLREARRAREKLAELEARVSGLEGEVRAKKESLKTKKEELEGLRREVEEINRALRKAFIVKWIRDNLFHKDGVPKYLRTRYIRLLESLMENLMNKFNLEYHSARIDEDYGIWLESTNYPGKKVGIRSLSGGEKVVVSLVAMLALYQLVAGGRIGFLALDEPTEYLDEDRREELVNVLKEFQGGRIIPQLLIVTHDENVREAGDKIFRVYKENGYSKVKPVEPGLGAEL